MSVDVSSPPEAHGSESSLFISARPISSPSSRSSHLGPNLTTSQRRGSMAGKGRTALRRGGLVKPLGSPTTLDLGLHLGASAAPVSCGLFQAGGRRDDVIRGARCRRAGCPALPSTLHFPSAPLWPSARGSNCLHKDAPSPSALPPK